MRSLSVFLLLLFIGTYISQITAMKSDLEPIEQPESSLLHQQQEPDQQQAAQDPQHDGVSCVICQDAEHGEFTTLPCHQSHRFHTNCLRAWLQHGDTCPLCHAQVPLEIRHTLGLADAPILNLNPLFDQLPPIILNGQQLSHEQTIQIITNVLHNASTYLLPGLILLNAAAVISGLSSLPSLAQPWQYKNSFELGATSTALGTTLLLSTIKFICNYPEFSTYHPTFFQWIASGLERVHQINFFSMLGYTLYRGNQQGSDLLHVCTSLFGCATEVFSLLFLPAVIGSYVIIKKAINQAVQEQAHNQLNQENPPEQQV